MIAPDSVTRVLTRCEGTSGATRLRESGSKNVPQAVSTSWDAGATGRKSGNWSVFLWGAPGM